MHLLILLAFSSVDVLSRFCCVYSPESCSCNSLTRGIFHIDTYACQLIAFFASTRDNSIDVSVDITHSKGMYYVHSFEMSVPRAEIHTGMPQIFLVHIRIDMVLHWYCFLSPLGIVPAWHSTYESNAQG